MPKTELQYEEEFLSYIQFNLCYSPNTISAYRRDLSLYKQFKASGNELTALYKFLEDRKLSERSQVRFISCLRSYLKFIESKGEKIDYIKYLQFPKLKKKLPHLVSFDDFQKLWQIVENKDRSLTLRNRLILSFLYGLGCRVSELVSLDVKDFNRMEHWITITGKGDRQRILPLSQELYTSLQQYLEESRPFFIKDKQAHLFFNNRGRRPSRIDIWRWLKAWSQQAGFQRVKNPHSFRHGCATILLEKGADLNSIQKLLGHLNIQTTQIYTSVASDHIREQIEIHHPLSETKKIS